MLSPRQQRESLLCQGSFHCFAGVTQFTILHSLLFRFPANQPMQLPSLHCIKPAETRSEAIPRTTLGGDAVRVRQWWGAHSRQRRAAPRQHPCPQTGRAHTPTSHRGLEQRRVGSTAQTQHFAPGQPTAGLRLLWQSLAEANSSTRRDKGCPGLRCAAGRQTEGHRHTDARRSAK